MLPYRQCLAPVAETHQYCECNLTWRRRLDGTDPIELLYHHHSDLYPRTKRFPILSQFTARLPSFHASKTGTQVCLGELPSTNSPHSRIYTAVCLLLESLRQAEEALGLPPQNWVGDGVEPREKGGTPIDKTFSNASTEQDTASDYWELLTRVNSIQELFTTFAKKVEDIKELLREKMGL